MADVTWRGDNPGFQTQAVGNYPDASDAADKDNIYLTEQGWVYRHFKSLDKSKYWDEIIWAGDVNNPPAANAPIDPINDPSPTFLVGDGIQYVEGPYPTSATGGAYTGVVDPSGDPIGNVAASFPATALVGSNIGVSISRTGNPSSWGAYLTSSDPGDVITDTGGGPPGGDANASGYKNIAFSNTVGIHTLTVTLTSPRGPIAEENGDTGSPDTPVIETYDIEVLPIPDPVTFTLTGAGAGNANYETSEGDNASISIPRGTVLTIVNNSGGHPVVISTTAGSVNEETRGVTGNPAGDGQSLVWDTGADYLYGSTYYYTCSSHPSTMYGQITLT